MRFQISDFRFQIRACSGLFFQTARSTVAFVGLLFLVFSVGCSSTKPPPPKPPAVAQAQRDAAQGIQLSEMQNWNAAARTWQNAADQYALLNDQTNQAIALHNFAQARRALGQLDEAHQLFEQAAALNEKHQLRKEWWRNQIALLQMEALSNDPAALQNRFAKLIPGASQIQDANLLGLFQNELGLWRQRQDEFAKAAEEFLRAQSSFNTAHNSGGVASVTANRAQLLEAQKNFEGAASAWRSALKQFEALADPRGITHSLAGQGRALLAANKDLPAAEDFLRRAAHNYRTLKSPADVSSTLELLAQCLAAEGKNAEAARVRAELPKGKEALPPEK